MVLSVISGVLLILCFPKFNLNFLAWVSLVPFFLSLMRCSSVKQAVLNGLVFALVYFGGVFFWVTSVSRWVGAFGWLAWASLVLYQSVYIMIFAFGAYLALRSFNRSTNLVIVPFMWGMVEWLRSFGEFGVPGGLVGLTQYQNLVVLQLASSTGVYGVSYLIVTVNLLIAMFLAAEGSFIEKAFGLQLKIAYVAVLLTAVYTTGVDKLNKKISDPYEREVKIALIQPNIDQASKLNPRNTYDMLGLLDFMSRSSFSKEPDIIIWPETAVMSFIEKDAAALLKLKDITKKGKCYLITGGFYSKDGKLFNSVFSVSPDGNLVSRYDKQHLVPFGEYLPFKWAVYPFLKSTGYFESDQTGNSGAEMLTAGPLRIGGLICFESLFDGLAKERSRGALFLLTVTNDGWFGSSSAAEQHIMAAPFRAVENRKYFVQAANTGISTVVDPYGRFIKRTRLNERAAVIFGIPSGSASR